MPPSAKTDCSERLARARACALSGQWPAAEQLYREVIGRVPDHVDALEGLGLAALHTARPVEALEWLERARQEAPKSARIVGHLGLALRHVGQLDRAIVRYEEAFALNPRDPAVLVNRARAERDAGRLGAAVESFRRALAVCPEAASIWSMLSNALREAGKLPDALAAARRALGLDPWLAEAHLNEGAALQRSGAFADAAASYIVAAANPAARRAALANLSASLADVAFARALAGRPALGLARRLLRAADPPSAALAADDAPLLYSLGRAELAAERFATAVGCLEWAARLSPSGAGHRELAALLERLGQTAPALDRLFLAIDGEPHDAQNYRLLGSWLSQRGRLAASDPRWSRAIQNCPPDVEALIRLGVAAQRLGHPSAATELYRRLVQLKPLLPDAHFYLGSALTKQGHFREAHAAYRRALQLDPECDVAHANLLFSLHFDPDLTREQIFEEHCAFGRRLVARAVGKSAARASIADRDPARRLRIGYVSPDFCAHAVAHFIEPVLAEHDPAAVQVFCYSDAPRPDRVTERLARRVPDFIACAGWSHAALFERIVADRIDILVDLAGHTAKNRLAVFARKPSPLAVSWLGYFDTTGLEAIDYRIADAHSVPPGEERFFVERVIRLPRSANCYLPPEAPDPAPPPCLTRGHITFGYFNNPTKLGRQVVSVFGRILRELPESHLVLKYRAFNDPELAARYLAWFAEESITPERIAFAGHSSMARYLAAFGGVDIALDPFPYSGETTALHGLWMGVPLVTLEGPALVQRLASRVLRVCGLSAWVASSEDGYVAVASALARDRAALTRTRALLRDRLRASPLLDRRGVTRDLEAAYREIWRAWCQRQS